MVHDTRYHAILISYPLAAFLENQINVKRSSYHFGTLFYVIRRISYGKTVQPEERKKQGISCDLWFWQNKFFVKPNLMQKHNAYIVTKQIINIYSQWSLEWQGRAFDISPLESETTDQWPDISECVLVYISRKRIQNFRVRLIDKMGRNMVYLIKMFPYRFGWTP